MTTSADRAGLLLEQLAGADGTRLVTLARYGRRRTDAPAFRGRCLAPEYLEAVANGEWTPDDEVLLGRLVEQAEATALPRVSWRHRRGLRHALRATTVSLLTEQVASPTWQRRRGDLAVAWTSSIGPLPAQRVTAG